MDEKRAMAEARTMPLADLLRACEEAERRNCEQRVKDYLRSVYYARAEEGGAS
jgi:hypothetical protein